MQMPLNRLNAKALDKLIRQYSPVISSIVNKTMTQNPIPAGFNEILLYTTPSGKVKVEIYFQNETIWRIPRWRGCHDKS